jgi:hypothetical protein
MTGKQVLSPKKRKKVYGMYKPGAKRRGHLLNRYNSS